jgi:hypothetical protein
LLLSKKNIFLFIKAVPPWRQMTTFFLFIWLRLFEMIRLENWVFFYAWKYKNIYFVLINISRYEF